MVDVRPRLLVDQGEGKVGGTVADHDAHRQHAGLARSTAWRKGIQLDDLGGLLGQQSRLLFSESVEVFRQRIGNLHHVDAGSEGVRGIMTGLVRELDDRFEDFFLIVEQSQPAFQRRGQSFLTGVGGKETLAPGGIAHRDAPS